MAVRITDTPSLSVVAIVRSSEWWRMNAGGREGEREEVKWCLINLNEMQLFLPVLIIFARLLLATSVSHPSLSRSFCLSPDNSVSSAAVVCLLGVVFNLCSPISFH